MKKLLLLAMAVVMVGCITDHGNFGGSDLHWDQSALNAFKKVTPDGLLGCWHCDVRVKGKAALSDHYLKAHGAHVSYDEFGRHDGRDAGQKAPKKIGKKVPKPLR